MFDTERQENWPVGSRILKTRTARRSAIDGEKSSEAGVYMHAKANACGSPNTMAVCRSMTFLDLRLTVFSTMHDRKDKLDGK